MMNMAIFDPVAEVRRITLVKTREAVERGEFPEGRIAAMLRFPEDSYSPEEVAFLEGCFGDEKRYELLVRVLCRFGHRIEGYLDGMPQTLTNAQRFALMRIAADQKDPASILRLIEGCKSLQTMAMILIQQTGMTEYLAEFMLTEDRYLSGLATQLLEKADNA